MLIKRQTIVVGTAWLLVLGSLACSISGEVNVESPGVTAQAGEERNTSEPATPTAVTPSEPTTAVETKAPDPTETPTGIERPEATEQAPDPTEAPAAPEAPANVEDPLEAADIPELETATLDPTGNGLGHLSSFRQRMTLDFTTDETGYNSVIQYESEVVPPEQAVHIAIVAEGPAAGELPSNRAEAIWIGDQLWLKIGNQPWLPVPEAVAAIRFDEQMLAVGDFLPYILHFERVGEKTVNGISSVHYTYDVENVPTEYGSFSGKGDVYVALDGGYIVRYTCDGHATFQEMESSGALNLVYDTYDVGAPLEINPPRR